MGASFCDQAAIVGIGESEYSLGTTKSELDLSLTYVHGAPVQRFAHALLSTNEEIFWP